MNYVNLQLMSKVREKLIRYFLKNKYNKTFPLIKTYHFQVSLYHTWRSVLQIANGCYL